MHVFPNCYNIVSAINETGFRLQRTFIVAIKNRAKLNAGVRGDQLYIIHTTTLFRGQYNRKNIVKKQT